MISAFLVLVLTAAIVVRVVNIMWKIYEDTQKEQFIILRCKWIVNTKISPMERQIDPKLTVK